MDTHVEQADELAGGKFVGDVGGAGEGDTEPVLRSLDRHVRVRKPWSFDQSYPRQTGGFEPLLPIRVVGFAQTQQQRVVQELARSPGQRFLPEELRGAHWIDVLAQEQTGVQARVLAMTEPNGQIHVVGAEIDEPIVSGNPYVDFRMDLVEATQPRTSHLTAKDWSVSTRQRFVG